MTTVRYSRSSQRDIRKLLRHLADVAGLDVASDFVQALDAFETRMTAYPQTSGQRPELGRGIRVAVIAPYLVIHQHRAPDDEVVILRVLHGRRNIGKDFLKLR